MFSAFKIRSQNYKVAFGTTEGLGVLHDLAKVCGAYSSSHVSGDPLQTALNEGKREVYLYIMRILEANDELIHRQYHQEVGREQLRSHLEQENDVYG